MESFVTLHAVASDGGVYVALEEGEIQRQESFGTHSISLMSIPLGSGIDVLDPERGFWNFNRKVFAVSFASAVIFTSFTIATFEVDYNYAYIAMPSGVVALITACMYVVHRI
jgi:hypothetical protein